LALPWVFLFQVSFMMQLKVIIWHLPYTSVFVPSRHWQVLLSWAEKVKNKKSVFPQNDNYQVREENLRWPVLNFVEDYASTGTVETCVVIVRTTNSRQFICRINMKKEL